LRACHLRHLLRRCLHLFHLLLVFSQNNFFVEKNPTIVNFPVKNMELRDIIPVPEGGCSCECV